jgi:undecaprenyl-diphosphatase
MVFDLPQFRAVNAVARATPWLHGLVVAYATYGEVLFAVLLAAGLWVAHHRVDPRALAAAVWTPAGMVAALGINQPIAAAVGEARPCHVLPSIVVVAHCGMDFSFPSDHATMVGATAPSRRTGSDHRHPG